jgi:hypothetical protein
VSPKTRVQTDGAERVRQNRVVLAVVATVKPASGDVREPDRADGIVNSRGEGGQNELGSRESAA